MALGECLVRTHGIAPGPHECGVAWTTGVLTERRGGAQAQS